MHYDVVALGELLIDFAPIGTSELGNPCFEANPGGAPCNVLAMLAKLGHKTAFIGKVGADIHGKRLKYVIQDSGINTSGLVVDPNADTTLAFVQLDDKGERDFSFFRRPGADTMLTINELDVWSIQNTRIFHFGSLSLTNQPARGATQKAVKLAKEVGAIISFDPNLRPPLWPSMEDAKEQIMWGCALCDVLKLAKEELEFLTSRDIANGVDILLRQFPNLKMVFVTDGKNGATAFSGEFKQTCPTYLEVKTVDTTGAGDTFMGCCLHCILENGLEDWTEEKLNKLLRFANAAASLVTTKKGAICAMPQMRDIKMLLESAEF